MDSEYRFRIADSFTPATIPMDRLAEYIALLAKLLGEQPAVHLQQVADGSTTIVAAIDSPARPKVWDRAQAIKAGTAPRDALKAFSDLDDMLRADGATGTLSGDQTGIVLPFPGRTRPDALVFGPVRQDGTLDGQVIRVGGKDEMVPVHLQDGPVTHTGLFTTRDMARKLAALIYGPTVRVHGTGTWFRASSGAWELKSFKITAFDELDDTPLLEVVAGLRKAEGNDWNTVPDPILALLEGRHADGDAH